MNYSLKKSKTPVQWAHTEYTAHTVYSINVYVCLCLKIGLGCQTFYDAVLSIDSLLSSFWNLFV